MSNDREWSRLAAAPASPQRYYAQLLTPAWAQAITNPFDANSPTPRNFNGKVGIMGSNGFEVIFPNSYIYFLVGACAGCFFESEIIEVVRWPFSRPTAWNPQWMAKGMGQIVAWTDYAGGNHRIFPGTSAGGGLAVAVHYISENETPQNTIGPTFPGMPFPYTLDGGRLDHNKPVKWKWLAAESKWCPILQAPTDSV